MRTGFVRLLERLLPSRGRPSISLTLGSDGVPTDTVALSASPSRTDTTPPPQKLAGVQSTSAPPSVLVAAEPLPISAPAASPMRLSGAALWSSLEAAGYMEDKISSAPPARALTPPEKAGVLAAFDRLRGKGIVFYRDHAPPIDANSKGVTVDLRPVDNAELSGLMDGPQKPWQWKLSYESQTSPQRYGFIHSLRDIADLAFFHDLEDEPHGLAEPAAGVALRQLLRDGWTARQCQVPAFVSKPLYPEQVYRVVSGGRHDQCYRDWYSFLLEPPSGRSVRVHTAAGLALLGPTPQPGTQFLQENRDGAFPQAALDIASLQQPNSSLQEARDMLAAATTHLLPLVNRGQIPEADMHHILDALIVPVPGTTVATRVALCSRLLDVATAKPDPSGWASARSLRFWNTMIDNTCAAPSAAEAQPNDQSFERAVASCPAGLPIERQIDLAERILPFVDKQEWDKALGLCLVNLPRHDPQSVDAAVRLIRARVPLAQVGDGLADCAGHEERLCQIEDLAQAAAAQSDYHDMLADYRAARDGALGGLDVAARIHQMTRLVRGLSQRGETSQARAIYEQLGATARDGRLADAEVAPTVTRFLDSFSSGGGLQRSMRLASPPRSTEVETRQRESATEKARRMLADETPDVAGHVQALAAEYPLAPAVALTASVLPSAVPETRERVARVGLNAQAFEDVSHQALPHLAARLMAEGSTAEEKVAIGTAALEHLSRTPGFEEGGRLALDATRAMAVGPLENPVEKRAEAIADVLPQIGAIGGDALVALGQTVLKHVRYGANVRHIIMEAVKDDADIGPTIRIGLRALGSFPKNLTTVDSAAAHILENRSVRGGLALAQVGQVVYRRINNGMNGQESWQAVSAYLDALKDDAEVGTAMWLAHDICNDEAFRKSSPYSLLDVAEAAFEHATASTGRDLASMCLSAFDKVPEGSPRSAIHMALPLFKALGSLFADGESRDVIGKAEREVSQALKVSMIFGMNEEGDMAARRTARAALVQLQNTEDATSRLHRRMSEAAAVGPVQQTEDYVMAGPVRIPRRKT